MSKKLAKVENLVVLPNTSIYKVVSTDGKIQKVELDNYSELQCSAIYAKTPAKIAVDFIPGNIISVEDGYLVVNHNCESTLIPKCFAAGACLNKFTKTMEQNLIESIIKDF